MMPTKRGLLFSGIIIFATATAAATQLVYYSYFRTYLTIFSVTQAGDVAHFWRDILLEIAMSTIPILLCAIVPILFVLMRDRFQKAPGIENLRRNAFGGSLLVFLLIFSVIMVYGGGPNTPKDALFKTNAISVSIPNLGVGTGMILDGETNIWL